MPIICTDAPFHYLKPMYLSLCMPIIYHCTAGTLPVALTPPYLQIYYFIQHCTARYLARGFNATVTSIPVNQCNDTNVPVMSYNCHLPCHARYLARGSNATVFDQFVSLYLSLTASYLARGSNATVISIPIARQVPCPWL